MDFKQRPLSGFSYRSYMATGALEHAAVTRFADWTTVKVDIGAGTWEFGTTDRGADWVGKPQSGTVRYMGAMTADRDGIAARVLNTLKPFVGHAAHISSPADNAAGTSWTETVIAVDTEQLVAYVWRGDGVLAIYGQSLIAEYAGRTVEHAI